MAHYDKAIDGSGTGELHRLERIVLTAEAARRSGKQPGPAAGAFLSRQSPFQGGGPEWLRIWIGVRIIEDRRHNARSYGRHQPLLNIVPLTGRVAGPPVTSAISASFTWLIAVPRHCSTASRIWVMPMI